MAAALFKTWKVADRLQEALIMNVLGSPLGFSARWRILNRAVERPIPFRYAGVVVPD